MISGKSGEPDHQLSERFRVRRRQAAKRSEIRAPLRRSSSACAVRYWVGKFVAGAVNDAAYIARSYCRLRKRSCDSCHEGASGQSKARTALARPAHHRKPCSPSRCRKNLGGPRGSERSGEKRAARACARALTNPAFRGRATQAPMLRVASDRITV